MEQAASSPVPSKSSSQVVHVEVCQTPLSTLRFSQVRELVKRYYGSKGSMLLKTGAETQFNDPVLGEHVSCITVSDVPLNEASGQYAIKIL